MISLPQRKRILICTFVALASGFFSSYVGGQISLKAQSHNCQTQPWGLFWTNNLSRDFWGRESVPINPDGSKNNNILKTACTAWVAPGAIWRGSTTGLWLGMILGAFVSGLATRKAEEKVIPPEDFTGQNTVFLGKYFVQKEQHLVDSLCADDLELTPAQKETLRRLLVLLVVKIGISSDNPEAEAEALSLEDLQRLAAIASQHQLIKQNLTLAEIQRLLLK